MRSAQDPKQRIKRMARKVRDLKQRASELEQQHKTLAIQHYVLACCCEMMHWMRTASVHSGWVSYKDTWLQEELPLLQELNTHTINDELSNPQQQPRLLEVQQQLQDPDDEGQEQQQEQQQDHADKAVGLIPEQTALNNTQHQLLQARQAGAMQQHSAAGAHVPAPTASTGTASAAQILAVARRSGSAAFRGSSACSSLDPSLLYVSELGDFLGPFRYALLHPPYPGGASITLQELGESYRDYIECSTKMLERLELLERGDLEVCGNEPHPIVVMRERLLVHIRLITTILLLHPDDLLNKFRLLNFDTMEIVEQDVDKAWVRMSEVVDQLGFTEQQQQLIAIGCSMFTRLIVAVMEERQQLTTQQQELLQLKDGRSVDLQQQEECAARLNLVVRKERFLSQCLGTYVTSVCSVVQIARLAQLVWPSSPQMAVMGTVLTQKLQQQQEERQRQRRQRRQGLPYPIAQFTHTAAGAELSANVATAMLHVSQFLCVVAGHGVLPAATVCIHPSCLLAIYPH